MRIICCGNLYRGDDGVGLLVAKRLRQLGIEVSTCKGEATELLEAMDGPDEVLIVDAVTTGAQAGTIHEWHDGAREFQHSSTTTHALGVAEGIALARVLGNLPERLHIYSIEATTFKAGGKISVELRQAADELAHVIADLSEAGART
jgi:hydrogenase maturation protease